MVKKSTFCKHRKCKRRGEGGQKKPNLVNVVCEKPLTLHLCMLFEKYSIQMRPQLRCISMCFLKNTDNEIVIYLQQAL